MKAPAPRSFHLSPLRGERSGADVKRRRPGEGRCTAPHPARAHRARHPLPAKRGEGKSLQPRTAKKAPNIAIRVATPAAVRLDAT